MGCSPMMERILKTSADMEEGAAHLCALCPHMARAYAEVAPLTLRLWPDGFAGLLDIIIGQQVSVASAAAIRGRMEAAGLMEAESVLKADDETLRAIGLSRQKIRYVRVLAEARIDYMGLQEAPREQVIATLTAVPGIGPWTAEIYTMLSLGRADVFAPGDLALQEATRLLYRLPMRPKAHEMRQRADAWTPWRSVAAQILWAYYRVAKNREGIG